MNKRATINSNTFEKIFNNKENLLSEMATSLTKEKTNIYQNQITSNKNNPKKLRYIITMPNDETIIIKDTYKKENIIINLKK